MLDNNLIQMKQKYPGTSWTEISGTNALEGLKLAKRESQLCNAEVWLKKKKLMVKAKASALDIWEGWNTFQLFTLQSRMHGWLCLFAMNGCRNGISSWTETSYFSLTTAQRMSSKFLWDAFKYRRKGMKKRWESTQVCKCPLHPLKTKFMLASLPFRWRRGWWSRKWTRWTVSY